MSNEKKIVSALPVPRSSWDTVKKIIRAFHASHEEDPRVEDIADLAGLPRPVVSANNGFLRALGIVRPDAWKLTDAGERYAMAITTENEHMGRQALREIVRSNSTLNKLISVLRARGPMKSGAFKVEMMLLLGLKADSPLAPYLKSLLDSLAESQVIVVDDDMIRAETDAHASESQPDIVHLQPHQQPADTLQAAIATGFRRIPVPVSTEAVWYVEIPEGATLQQLEKFLDLQRIIFEVRDK